MVLTGCALFAPPPREWVIPDDELRGIERTLLVAYGRQVGRLDVLCRAPEADQFCREGRVFLAQLEAAYKAVQAALKPAGGKLDPGVLNGALDLIIKAAPLVGGLAL